jgi:hypothetical protein
MHLPCFLSNQIHQLITGRIKLLKNGQVINSRDTPEIDFEDDVPSEFDRECGTFALDPFKLPQPICPDRFACHTTGKPHRLQTFASCIDAMNCHMLAGMTIRVGASSPKILFLKQMIPHHQNAVNMAKALLKTGQLDCQDVTKETEDCIMMALMHSIIGEQNFQIQFMRQVLETSFYLEPDKCDHYSFPTLIDSPTPDAESVTSGKALALAWSFLPLSILVISLL